MHVRWDEGAQATPHGQLVFFAQFLAATGVFERWVSQCPLAWRSGNAPDKRDVLGTLMLGLLAGHRRYAHITALRGDAGLIFNGRITLKNIPPETHEYVVNGKSALEWVMERYEPYTDKDSGIKNDPNEWCREHDDPAYILNLVKRVIRVSVETVKIVGGLPSIQ